MSHMGSFPAVQGRHMLALVADVHSPNALPTRLPGVPVPLIGVHCTAGR